MSDIKSHIIIIDGSNPMEKETLALELSLALIYNNWTIALMLTDNSQLNEILKQRKNKNLPSPDIISREMFINSTSTYNAIIIPSIKSDDILASYAQTYITVLYKDTRVIRKFKADISYMNSLWELKKKIAARYKRSLDWVVCENAPTTEHTKKSSPVLSDLSRHFGFRLADPISFNVCCRDTLNGISSQDKKNPPLQKELTYNDIYSNMEIIKLAEFIFNQ